VAQNRELLETDVYVWRYAIPSGACQKEEEEEEEEKEQ